MKGQYFILSGTALFLASCETGELNTSGGFDPLTAPGSGRTTQVVQPGYRPGSFVRTSMDAAFFLKRPKGNTDADKQVPANTEMKVISDDGSFVKVELNNGEVGYVPSVLVSDSAAAPVVPSPDAYQVYPPAPGSGIPAVTDPSIPSIPPVIDPEAPVIPDDVPLVPSEPTPLPPGNESLGGQ